MKKRKIYLDISFISYLIRQDGSEKAEHTQLLWQEIVDGLHVTCVSDVTLAEIEALDEPIKSQLLEFLKLDVLVRLSETEQTLALAGKYLELGALTGKVRDERRHIAIASVSECDYIVTWKERMPLCSGTNFNNKVHAVNVLCNCGGKPEYLIPPMLISTWDMSYLDGPDYEISPDFTIEDIHKIRVMNYERTKSMTQEERLADTKARTADIMKRLAERGVHFYHTEAELLSAREARKQ